jgi:hypothetical protein
LVGSRAAVVGCGAVVSVDGAASVVGVVADAGVFIVVVLVEVPVLVWALTTTPSATVLDVVFSVVVVVVVFDSDGWVVVDGCVDGVWVVPVVVPVFSVGVEFEPVDPVEDEVFEVLTLDPAEVVSSAAAMPYPVAIAVPTPNATASPPTRPI